MITGFVVDLTTSALTVMLMEWPSVKDMTPLESKMLEGLTSETDNCVEFTNIMAVWAIESGLERPMTKLVLAPRYVSSVGG